MVKTNKAKLTRFLPVAAIAEAGFLNFVRAPWNDKAFEELENFNGERHNGHDDIADTLSDAILVLNQSRVMPELALYTPSHTPMNTLSYNNTITSVAHTFNNTNGILNIHNN